jgi:hypothetical protein
VGYAVQIEKRSRPASQKHVPTAVPSIMRHAASQDIRPTKSDRCACGGALPRFLAKSALKISEPGDAHEREADAVADRVMRIPGGDVPIMRKAISGASCESTPSQEPEEEDQEEVMRSPVSGQVQRHPDLAARLGESRTSGSPLPDGVRSFMESRIGADFRGVRVHTDSPAVRMTEELSAAAFTSGDDIYFRAGYYQPDAAAGRKLLAHELTHVVQQQAGRATPTSGEMPILRYTLNGFPAAEASLMDSAIASAKATVGSCDYLTWFGKHDITTALESVRYDYVPDLGLCGWTFPSSWYIEVGSKAFNQQKCCDLASTLAHEASHVMWRTEGGARKMECECFGCSC